MQPIQQRILDFLYKNGSFPLRLRELGRNIGVEHPQLVKYHLLRLTKRNLVHIDKKRGLITPTADCSATDPDDLSFISIPIFGAANCGDATLFAYDKAEGFLKTSPGLINGKSPRNVFALKASGESMNNADINGQPIDDGDYVLIDSSKKIPSNGDYIVSVIDDCVNIKRYFRNVDDDYITLLSDSKQNYPPIFIHEGDSYHCAGKVFKVLKMPH